MPVHSIDIAVVGAGPVGAALCGLLRGCGLSIALIDRQPAEALLAPAEDGREIALTRRSLALLGLAGFDLGPARAAPLERVVFHLGRLLPALSLRCRGQGGHSAMVGGAAMRRAATAAIAAPGGPLLFAGSPIVALRPRLGRIEIALADGRHLSARLLVGADSARSAVRRLLGVPCRQTRSDRAALICTARPERPDAGVGHAWPLQAGSLYLSPLGHGAVSAVLTGTQDEIRALAALPEAALGDLITARSGGRLGRIEPGGRRDIHPLNCHWSSRFTGPRCALLGEAAVGVHPITAQGLNLGIRGAARLAGLILEAVRRGEDIGAPALLARYDRAQRRLSRPWYLIGRLLLNRRGWLRPFGRNAKEAIAPERIASLPAVP